MILAKFAEDEKRSHVVQQRKDAKRSEKAERDRLKELKSKEVRRKNEQID